ncbi:glycerol 2-dehydrogenase (NAD+) [Pelagirhabdus alkalitolerans]|uniref:Glycerol dehydrogenase n=1 Tax=Pelagirhabdus alkalitolerans TaxID=1612202 RepID=A0A1G6GGA7_9BACI|nr:glycerol dehydrogenase [Pelagirhabdus alkalitolerans]SDB80863.1 glycerol 2-dehydrogenase (NAD+) [Pelagirhabdus alkalitolerans]
MDKVFGSPSRYVQGKDLVSRTSEYIKPYGTKFLVLADETVQEIVANDLIVELENDDYKTEKVTFGGECSFKEIERITKIGKENDIDGVLGVGTGKAIDTAKAVAIELDVSLIIFNTLASSDAPTSALSVIYTEDGEFETYQFYNKNPDMVLNDTRVISQGPPHMMASGISDALATLIEATATHKAYGENMHGGKGTIAGLAIAEKCEQILFDHGVQAYEANKEKVVTPALEAVVEANTLLSGLGFENGGIAGAHAIHNGFTALHGEIHNMTHGQKVAYGIMTQLILENRSEEELERYIDFMLKLDLPITMKDLHLDEASDEDLRKVAEAAVKPEDTMTNMPFDVTADDVVQAIKAVDVYVKSFKQKYNVS